MNSRNSTKPDPQRATLPGSTNPGAIFRDADTEPRCFSGKCGQHVRSQQECDGHGPSDPNRNGLITRSPWPPCNFDTQSHASNVLIKCV